MRKYHGGHRAVAKMGDAEKPTELTLPLHEDDRIISSGLPLCRSEGDELAIEFPSELD